MSDVWQDETKVSALKTLWVDGVSVPEIAQRLGIGTSAVIGKAHKLGLPPHANAKPSGWTAARVLLLKALNAAGLSAAEIADELGEVSESSVRRALKLIARGKPPRTREVDDWPDAKTETLKRLWLEGIETDEIGTRLGVTGRAVSAKVTRLRDEGVNLPARSTKPPPRGGRKTLDFSSGGSVSPLLKPPRDILPSRDAAEIAANLPATGDPLNSGGCRWPIGDPATIGRAQSDFRFCQQPKGRDTSYCDAHERIARAKPFKGTPRPHVRRGALTNRVHEGEGV